MGFRKDQKKIGEESLWEQMGRKEKKESPSRWGEWFKKRIIGEKTAAEIAEEQAEELKKKKNGI
jgi:hypothetical protein